MTCDGAGGKPRSSEHPGADQRSAERYPSVHFIWYRILENEAKSPGVPLEGLCKMDNISETGVGLYVVEPLPTGKTVFLEIAATKFNVTAMGRIVFCGDRADGYHRVGIVFLAVSPNHRLLLKTWLLQGCDNRMRRSRPPSRPPDYPGERRAAKRYPSNEFVWYHVVDDGKDVAKTSSEGVCLLTDVSETGIGFCTADPLPIGGRMFVEITTKIVGISAVGRIVHSAFVATRHYRAGLRFEVMPPNDHLLLCRALNSNETP